MGAWQYCQQEHRLRESLKRCHVRRLALDGFNTSSMCGRRTFQMMLQIGLKNRLKRRSWRSWCWGFRGAWKYSGKMSNCAVVLEPMCVSVHSAGISKKSARSTGLSSALFRNSFRVHHAGTFRYWNSLSHAYSSYGLIGYTMKIIRGAVRIASSQSRGRSRCELWRNPMR